MVSGNEFPEFFSASNPVFFEQPGIERLPFQIASPGNIQTITICNYANWNVNFQYAKYRKRALPRKIISLPSLSQRKRLFRR